MRDAKFVVCKDCGIHGNIVLTEFPDYPSLRIESREQGQKIVAFMYIQRVVSVETAGKLLRQMDEAKNLPKLEETVDIAYELAEAIRASSKPSDTGRDVIMFFGGPALTADHPARNAHLC